MLRSCLLPFYESKFVVPPRFQPIRTRRTGPRGLQAAEALPLSGEGPWQFRPATTRSIGPTP